MIALLNLDVKLIPNMLTNYIVGETSRIIIQNVEKQF